MRKQDSQLIKSLEDPEIASCFGSGQSASDFRGAMLELDSAFSAPGQADAATLSCFADTQRLALAQPWFNKIMELAIQPPDRNAGDWVGRLAPKIKSALFLATAAGWSEGQMDAMWLLAFHQVQAVCEKPTHLMSNEPFRQVAALNAAYGLSSRLAWAQVEWTIEERVQAAYPGSLVYQMLSGTVQALVAGALAMDLNQERREESPLSFFSARELKIAKAALAIVRVGQVDQRIKTRAEEVLNATGWVSAVEKRELDAALVRGSPMVKRRAC